MTRTADTKLHALFLDRWSPRAFDGSDMPDADLQTILDAARFAPSAMLSEAQQAREVVSSHKPRDEIAYPGDFRN